MTEGTLVEWLVADGDDVATGAPLYILETDKVENEIESPASGRVRHIAQPGETLPVGSPLGEILG